MLSGLKLADSMARSDAGSLACHPVAGFSFPGRSLADLSLACRWLVAGLSLASWRLCCCLPDLGLHGNVESLLQLAAYLLPACFARLRTSMPHQRLLPLVLSLA